MSQESSVDTDRLAVERTHMAVERTYFATLRTGLAIAGAGTVVVGIVGEDWPEWLSLLLSAVFVVVGYTMILVTLNRYQKIVNRLKIEHKLDVVSPKLTVLLTVVLQVALAAVLVLFLLGLFITP
jgi:uncharacterized membrane protein YidH (DUF202 family)